jgi:hypothetical protein
MERRAAAAKRCSRAKYTLLSMLTYFVNTSQPMRTFVEIEELTGYEAVRREIVSAKMEAASVNKVVLF